MQRRNLIAGVASLVLLGACGKAVKQAAIAPSQVVLAFGDSVTFSTGVAPGEAWPSHLAGNQCGHSGRYCSSRNNPNSCISGRASTRLGHCRDRGQRFFTQAFSQGCKRKHKNFAQVDQAIWSLGGACSGPGVVPHGNLCRQVERFTDLQGISGGGGVPIVSDVFPDVLLQPELCADKIHPNSKGYRQMASGLFARFREIGCVR
jgi:acyl-CoA thioesterase-1